MSAGPEALSRARHLVALQRWQEAIDALGPAAADAATAADAHCLRAQCELGLGQPRWALASAKAALGIDPADEWALRLLSIGYLQTGRKKQARDAAREALRANPGSVHGYHVLALALVALKDRKGAREAAAAAVEADPHMPLAHETMGLVRSADGDWPGAEAAYREGLRLAPEDADMAVGLANALRRQRRRDEAAEAYLAAGRSDPTNHGIRQSLGRVGLPALLTSGLVLKLSAYAGLQAVFRLHPAPLTVAAILFGVLAGGAALTTALRVNGTRLLPDEVRAGLHGEHRNAALGWLRAAGFLAALLGIWAALRTGPGGGALLAACFVAFAVAAILSADALRVGPRQGWRAFVPSWRPWLRWRRA